MSGAMRRIGEYLGLLEDTGRYDDEYAQMDDPRYDDTYDGHYPDETSPVAAERPTRREAREARQAATVAHLDDRRRGGAPTMTAGSPGRRAVPDHDAAPSHLQRGPHRR